MQFENKMTDELDAILSNLSNPHFLTRAQTNVQNPSVRAAANSLFVELGLDINLYRNTYAPTQQQATAPAFISHQFSGNIANLPDNAWTIIRSS